MDYSGLPEGMQGAAQRYIENRIPMGSFGMAVVCNDLREACARADDTNRPRLAEIVSWFYTYAPSSCWGSEQRVSEWLNQTSANRP